MHNNYLVVLTHPQVTVFERFGRNNISLTLVWTRQMNDINASYNVSIKPQAAIILIGDTSVHIIADYNTLYNASIVASLSPCNTATTVVRLYYCKFYCMINYNNV